MTFHRFFYLLLIFTIGISASSSTLPSITSVCPAPYIFNPAYSATAKVSRCVLPYPSIDAQIQFYACPKYFSPNPACFGHSNTNTTCTKCIQTQPDWTCAQGVPDPKCIGRRLKCTPCANEVLGLSTWQCSDQMLVNLACLLPTAAKSCAFCVCPFGFQPNASCKNGMQCDQCVQLAVKI